MGQFLALFKETTCKNGRRTNKLLAENNWMGKKILEEESELRAHIQNISTQSYTSYFKVLVLDAGFDTY